MSLCSFLPVFLTSVFITGPSRLWFLVTAISLLLHQILDIANKKQAYRLQTFSFGTYYFDHMCDSFSCMLIVYIIGTLFQVSHNWLWLLIFLCAMLPFYVHHLTMYYTEYMCFPAISPATEGNSLIIFRSSHFVNTLHHRSYLSHSFLEQNWWIWVVQCVYSDNLLCITLDDHFRSLRH